MQVRMHRALLQGRLPDKRTHAHAHRHIQYISRAQLQGLEGIYVAHQLKETCFYHQSHGPCPIVRMGSSDRRPGLPEPRQDETKVAFFLTILSKLSDASKLGKNIRVD